MSTDTARILGWLREHATEQASEAVGMTPQDFTAWHAAALIESQAAEIDRLRAELSAATGYMLNAKIDLETGATKRTAITTIEGGLRRARAVLPPATEGE